jgi:biopolymer transport protein ExbB
MWDLFRHAGWAAYPLGICSVIALGIVLERLYTLARLRRVEADAFALLLRRFEQTGLLDLGSLNDEMAVAPCVRVLDALHPMRAANPDARAEAARVAFAQQRLRLRRFLPGLATIATIAPFIGLFGTVLGVISAFQAMATSGLSGETMAGGISEALSATALGLLVAVPSVVMYNYFTNAVGPLLLDIQTHAVRLNALPEIEQNRRSGSAVVAATGVALGER